MGPSMSEYHMSSYCGMWGCPPTVNACAATRAVVVGVPLAKVLHLKSAVTALPDGTVIGWDPVVDDRGVWERYESVPEEPGCHVVVLDEDTVLMSSAAPLTRARFEERGLRVVPVDIGELEKLEGCVTCLSVRLRGAPEPT